MKNVTCTKAMPGDVNDIVIQVESLIRTLTGDTQYAYPADGRMAIERIVNDPELGFCLLARCEGRCVGFIGVSLQHAIRTAGRYAIIQELHVDPDHQSAGIGAMMIDQAKQLVSAAGIIKVEVGLPTEKYSTLGALRAFYGKEGFVKVGDRLRLTL